jgi:hypothetical protein
MPRRNVIPVVLSIALVVLIVASVLNPDASPITRGVVRALPSTRAGMAAWATVAIAAVGVMAILKVRERRRHY